MVSASRALLATLRSLPAGAATYRAVRPIAAAGSLLSYSLPWLSSPVPPGAVTTARRFSVSTHRDASSPHDRSRSSLDNRPPDEETSAAKSTQESNGAPDGRCSDLVITSCPDDSRDGDDSDDNPIQYHDGCDFKHWLVVVQSPPGDYSNPITPRDEIIEGYIKTLAQVVGSEEEARQKIYSVSTRCYFAFGALVSEELSHKLKELPNVGWVLPDSYIDIKNKDYGGEPFINGKAVPYDPKYHEVWVKNNELQRYYARKMGVRNNDHQRYHDRQHLSFDRSWSSFESMMNEHNPDIRGETHKTTVNNQGEHATTHPDVAYTPQPPPDAGAGTIRNWTFCAQRNHQIPPLDEQRYASNHQSNTGGKIQSGPSGNQHGGNHNQDDNQGKPANYRINSAPDPASGSSNAGCHTSYQCCCGSSPSLQSDGQQNNNTRHHGGWPCCHWHAPPPIHGGSQPPLQEANVVSKQGGSASTYQQGHVVHHHHYYGHVHYHYH